MNPQRIMAYPYSVWLAPQGTIFPKVGESEAEILTKKQKNLLPATSGSEYIWTRLGTSGTKDYSEAGVTVTHSQTIASFQGAGSTWVRKAWRSDEGMTVAFDLADISPSQYALVMDEIGVFTTTGSEQHQGIILNRGLQVKGYSMFMRGISSLTEGKVSQYEIPYCYQGGNPAPKYAIKGGPALLSCQFVVMEGDSSLEASEAEIQSGAKVGVYPKLRVGF